MDCEQFFKILVKKGLLLQISTVGGHVFETPMGLLPFKGHKHHITLKKGS